METYLATARHHLHGAVEFRHVEERTPGIGTGMRDEGDVDGKLKSSRHRLDAEALLDRGPRNGRAAHDLAEVGSAIFRIGGVSRAVRGDPERSAV